MAAFSNIVFLLQFIGLSLCLVPLQIPPQTLRDEFVLIDFRQIPRSFSRLCYKGITTASNRNYNACMAILPAEIHTNFSTVLPRGGCSHMANTSSTASYNNCSYSTNGGYFNTTNGQCIGNIITNGIIQQLSGISRVNFGTNNHSYIIGYLTNNTLNDTSRFNFSQLLTGAGWLVKSGMSYINESIGIEKLDIDFVTKRTPRTGICVASNGSLILLQVDGEEDNNIGINLFEFANILIEIGCWQAVNLDGGGSSTTVYRGKVINRPTCKDTSTICERSVSSITCIKT